MPSEEQLREYARQAILPVEGLGQCGVVVLPDSPTFTAALGTLASNSAFTRDFTNGLSAILGVAEEAGYATAIIDFSPGLASANGHLLSFLNRRYDTRLVLISTSRASDFATAIYEGTWAAARGEFWWRTPVLHLLNMWQEDHVQDKHGGKHSCDQYETTLQRWTDAFLRRGLVASAASGEGDWSRTDSGTQILHWRMWSYLYVLGVPSSGELFSTAALPYDAKVAGNFGPREKREGVGVEFTVDPRALAYDTDWGRELRRALGDRFQAEGV